LKTGISGVSSMQSDTMTTWAGVDHAGWEGSVATVESDVPPSEISNPSLDFLGEPLQEDVTCAGDPFEDFDDDDFDDEFDDDFEEEWDEELPGDADQFEPDEKVADDDAEPEFDDDE